jgi:hypothetical protein
MLNLPPPIMTVLMPFAPLFQAKTWRKVPVLLIGTILAPGKRTVTAALRVMGLGDEVNYAKYHHVLSRAAWSPLGVAECLLILLVKTFCPEDKPLVFGIDETIERRWGPKIAAASTAIRCGPARAISSKPAGCAGSA